MRRIFSKIMPGTDNKVMKRCTYKGVLGLEISFKTEFSKSRKIGVTEYSVKNVSLESRAFLGMTSLCNIEFYEIF